MSGTCLPTVCAPPLVPLRHRNHPSPRFSEIVAGNTHAVLSLLWEVVKSYELDRIVHGKERGIRALWAWCDEIARQYGMDMTDFDERCVRIYTPVVLHVTPFIACI